MSNTSMYEKELAFQADRRKAGVEFIKIKKVNNPEYAEYSDILEGAVILSIDGIKAKDMETVSSYLAKKENQKARYQIISKNGQMYSIIM